MPLLPVLSFFFHFLNALAVRGREKEREKVSDWVSIREKGRVRSSERDKLISLGEENKTAFQSFVKMATFHFVHKIKWEWKIVII